MDANTKNTSEGRKIKKKVDEDMKKSTSQLKSPKSSKKCNEIPSIDDGPWKKTIKATISDIRKEKDFYMLYLEDEDIGLEKYEEESMLLDGLHKWLYVTFKDKETARKAFEMNHDPTDSNILKVEMATPEDFDTYPNLLFLYGFDIQSAEDTDSLKDLIQENTDKEVDDICYHDEPKAAVIIFDEDTCIDITSLTWELTSLNGMKMITAPVYKKNSLLVSGLDETIPQSPLERYMKNKKRSGGGPIQSLQYLSDEEAVITFENEADYNEVLSKKGQHKIGQMKLDVSQIYPCLIRNYLEQFKLDVSPPSHMVKKASHTEEMNIKKTSRVQPDHMSTETLAFSESLDLNEEELSILEKSELLLDLKKTNKAIQIKFEHEKNIVIIQANLKTEIQEIILEILKMCRQNITVISLTTLTTEQQKFIRNEHVLLKLNSLLPNAYLKCCNTSFKLFYMKSEDSKILTDIVESQISMTKKPLNSDMVNILQSNKGETFLSELMAASDKTQVCPSVKVDAENEFLLMLGPKGTIYSLEKDIDRFLELNQVIVKETPFSQGKQHFVGRFLQEELNEIKQNIGEEVEIIHLSNKYIVKGLKDPVEECYNKLTYLSSKIKYDKVKLKYHGIQEFLQDHEVKSKIKEVEEKNNCVIIEDTEYESSDTYSEQSTVPQSLVLRAKANIDGAVTVNFMLGNILELKVDAIVNPLNSTLNLTSGLSKAILKKGGSRINTELYSPDAFKGIVQETTSGNLSNIKAILHVKCSNKETSDLKELRLAVKSCLEWAAKKGYQSIGFPAVGIDKLLKFSLLPACKCLVKEVIDFSESERTSLTNIYLCDNKDNVVDELTDRFEAISTNSKLEKNKDVKKETLAPQKISTQKSKSHTGKSKDFLGLNVKVIQGEINRQKTDVIVITVDKSLDLKKGRISQVILREAGLEIQNELDKNYQNGIKPGEFAKTSGGQLFCQNIFYACISRYKQGSEFYLGKLVEKLFQEADQLKITSISIPALGTGKLGYPADVSAEVIAKAIKNFTKSNTKTSLRIIKIVVFPADQDVFYNFSSFFPSIDKRRQDDSDDSSSDIDKKGASHQTSPRYTKKAEVNDSVIKFGRVSLNIVRGDILKERKCDVIVNGIKDNMDLSKSGQVCKALLDVCGSELQDECTEKKETMEEEGVVVTSAPNLSCKNIIHVSQDKFAKSWNEGITKVLFEADSMEAKSLALPALGTGSRHADVRKIKKLIFEAIENFGKKRKTTLTSIKLVIYDQRVFDAFMEQQTEKDHSSSVQEKENGLSSETVLAIYSQDLKNIKTATWDIESFCTKNYKEISEKDDPTAKKLTKDQVKLLEQFGVQQRVNVSIKIDEGIFKLQGFNMDGVYLLQKKMQTLVLEAMEHQHKIIQKSLPSAIVWQFKRGSKWIKYEPLLNSDLEQQYKQKARYHEITDSSGDKYEIDYVTMKANLLDDDDSIVETYEIQRVDLTKEGEPLPSDWSPMKDNEDLKEIELKAASSEYKKVEKQVIDTNGNIQIKKILRIQNKTLYQQYAVKKRDLLNQNPKGHQNELQLFHGTAHTAVPQINMNGFNRSYCGVNGTMYGKGVYFHKHASYSVSYAKPDAQNNHYLYLARVLVGESTPANAQMAVLPSKPGSNRTFDSAVSGDIYINLQFYSNFKLYPAKADEIVDIIMDLNRACMILQ
ncbi:hypothetical protein Btru_004357 [Bulinus truncatus]|nr:hypothetical protein Btru_004357 [Bulinus truncatus]